MFCCWFQEGKKEADPKLDTLLAPDTDSEEEPDVELQIPANKIKYMVGQGGDKIKYIQRKTKCRVQVSSKSVLSMCFLISVFVCATSRSQSLEHNIQGNRIDYNTVNFL